jgi:nicotinamide phosphoribosyltransferase
MNPLFLIDGYKLDHRRQAPPGLRRFYSNWTPRGSRVPGQDRVVFFGLQAFIQKYLVEEFTKGFFDLNVDYVCEKYEQGVARYVGPNDIGSDHIRQLHDLQYLPLEFRALPEGTACPLRVPMLTVENTHPDFAWLVGYIETIMSASLWMPCTSATSAWRLRQLLEQWCVITGGDPAFVDWQGHDFSMRGMGGVEAACLSAGGHLLSFTGTDTMPVLEWVDRYYPGHDNGTIGGTVPATEHSVMCAGGKETEAETFSRLLDVYPRGIVSIVSDTWDLWKVITEIMPSLRGKIMSRDGKVVVRPDSGDPVKIICGDAEADRPEARRGVVGLLFDKFGGTVNAAGYRQLDPHVGVIYGDAITYDRAKQICTGLAHQGFASTNIVFGVGSFTYQYTTRDTYGFAMKATWAEVDGEPRNLFKKPVTDTGEKFSATGRLAVLEWNGHLVVFENATEEQERHSLLEPVWRDGAWLRRQSLKDVRCQLKMQ